MRWSFAGIVAVSLVSSACGGDDASSGGGSAGPGASSGGSAGGGGGSSTGGGSGGANAANVTTLAMGATQFGPIALGANDVYFVADESSLESVPKTGGAPTMLAMVDFGTAYVLAADATSLYAAGNSGLRRFDLATKSWTVLDPAGSGDAIALDDANVYYHGSTELRAVAKTGGAPTKLADEKRTLAGIAVTADTVVWATEGGLASGKYDGEASIQKVPKSGGSPTVLFDGTNVETFPHGLALDETYAYVGADGGSYAGASNVQGGIFRVALDGSSMGQLELVAPNGCGTAVAVDAMRVYFAAACNGQVGMVAKTGGNPTTLASFKTAMYLVMDDAAVYSAAVPSQGDGGAPDPNGALVRIAKP